MKGRLIGTLAVAAGVLACEEPLPPAECAPHDALNAIVGYSTDSTICFEDPNLDVLTYTAVSSNSGVATAFLSGTHLEVTGVDEGRANIVVTAVDPGGLTGTANIPVTVEYPAELSLESCTGRQQGSLLAVEIRGSVRTNTTIDDVIAIGYVGTRRVGSDRLGNMRRGERASFLIAGTISNPLNNECEVDVRGNVRASGDLPTAQQVIGQQRATLRP